MNTEHSEEKEAIESALARTAIYREVALCVPSVTRVGSWTTHDDGSITGPNYTVTCAPSAEVKALIDASLGAPADPPAPPSGDPPADEVTVIGQTLAPISSDPIRVGDKFYIQGTLQLSDGSTRPVSAYRFYGFDAAVIGYADKAWTPLFVALAEGTTTLKSDNAGTQGVATVTVLAADPGRAPTDPSPPAPPPSDDGDPTPPAPPAPPPPPKAEIKAWTPADLGWVDQAPSGNRVDVDIVLTDGTHLSLYDAPLGVSPLKLDDGSLHDHLTVARYRDAVKIENKWMRGTQNFAGHLNVQIDNALAFSQDNVQFWLGCATSPIRTGLPQYTRRPVDRKLIPNYGGGATKQLSRAGKDFGLNGLGFDTTARMGQGGGRIDIGAVPGQALAYAINGLYFDDLQDFEDHAAVWPVHFRDEATGQPVDPTVQATASRLGQHLGYKYARGVNPMVGKSASPNEPNVAHLTHHAVVGYLATGSDLYAEELAFWAGYAVFSQNAWYRGYEKCVIGKNSQTRHVAWGLTMEIFAARLLPESYPMKAAARASVRNTATYWWDERYAPGKPCHNPFGFMLCVAYKGKDGTLGMAPWQEHFLTSALHLGVRLGFEELRPWAKFSASFAVGSMTEMCPQLGNNYEMFVCDPAKFTSRSAAEASSAQLVGTWTDIEARTRTNYVQGGNAEYAKPCGQMKLTYAGVGMMYGANGSPESFAANMQPALAAAVDLELSRAQEAWETFGKLTVPGDYSAHAQFNIVPVAVPA